MIGRLAIVALLALATLTPPRQAAAQDAIGGAIVGGVGGAILGGALGGRRGAAVGAVLGATTGAAVAAQGERRGSYYYYQNGCYMPQPDGSYVVVSPAYCDVAVRRWLKFTGRAALLAEDGRTFEQIAEARGEATHDG